MSEIISSLLGYFKANGSILEIYLKDTVRTGEIISSLLGYILLKNGVLFRYLCLFVFILQKISYTTYSNGNVIYCAYSGGQSRRYYDARGAHTA